MTNQPAQKPKAQTREICFFSGYRVFKKGEYRDHCKAFKCDECPWLKAWTKARKTGAEMDE